MLHSDSHPVKPFSSGDILSMTDTGGSTPDDDDKYPWLLPVVSIVLQVIAILVALGGIFTGKLVVGALYIAGGIGLIAPVGVLAWDEYSSNKNSKTSIAGAKHGAMYLGVMFGLSLFVAGASLKAVAAKSHTVGRIDQSKPQAPVKAPPYHP